MDSTLLSDPLDLIYPRSISFIIETDSESWLDMAQLSGLASAVILATNKWDSGVPSMYNEWNSPFGEGYINSAKGMPLDARQTSARLSTSITAGRSQHHP